MMPFAKKVVWAVDAFHEMPNDQLRVGKALNLLFGKIGASLQPVSVLLSGRYNPAEQTFPEKWSDLARAAKNNLEALFEDTKITNLKEPRLIKQEGASVKKGVQTLLQFALEENADLITVSTHSRKGAARLVMGSFAETLVLQSPIPVLVINPKWQPAKKLKHILFPTDFSDASSLVFDRVLRLAKELNCEVLLFHKIESLYPYLGHPFVVPVVSKESISEMTKSYHEKGEAWASRGKSLGVQVKFYLANKPGYALDEILKVAKKASGSGMIAIASQSGPIESVLLGSLTRQVLRSAPCPVLTIHPHQEGLVTKTVGQLKQAAYTYGSHPLIS